MAMYRKHTKLGSIGIIAWLTAYIAFMLWFWTIIPTNFWINLIYFPIAGFLWVPVAIRLIKYCNKDNE